MSKRRRLLEFSLAGIVIFVALASILAMTWVSRDGLRNGEDKKGEGPEDGPHDDNWTGPDPQIYRHMNVTIKDAYTTDKVTGYEAPPLATQVFLVFDLEISNPLAENLTIAIENIMLRSIEGSIRPKVLSEYLGRALKTVEVILPGSSISGLLHFPVFFNQTWSNITYEDNRWNVTFTYELHNLSGLDHRPWKTPLVFQITKCGREPNGSGKEQFLYFDLWVRNPSDNATHFQCWLIDLFCHNGVKLDGLFVPAPKGPFPPGGNVTYRVYFDIPHGSPDRPKTLFESLEGMSIDIDEGLYAGLI